jgi:hypothetical protein
LDEKEIKRKKETMIKKSPKILCVLSSAKKFLTPAIRWLNETFPFLVRSFLLFTS